MALAHASMFGANSIGNGAPRGGAQLCGALSVETFVNQSPLSLTHDDAAGWLGYPVSDKRGPPDRRASSFQHGTITWTPSGAAVVAGNID